MTRKAIFVLTAWFFFSPDPGWSQQPSTEAEVTAVAARFSQGVTLSEITDGATGRTRPVRLRETIRPGFELHVPEGATAGLVCSTERWIELRGRVTWRPTPAACTRGRKLPSGTFLSVRRRIAAPRSRDGFQVLEARPRTGRPGADAPVVLSPLPGALREARPAIRWTAVAGAAGYQLEIGSLSYRADAGEVDCAADEDWDLAAVCTLVLPKDLPDLPPGRKLTLRVSALPGPAHSPYSQVLIRRVKADAETAFRERLAALGALPVPARQILEVSLYADEGFSTEAVAGYQALARSGSEEAALPLAELYLRTGLDHLAERSYEELSKRPKRELQAAAAHGLGRIAAARDRREEARAHLLRARQVYLELGRSDKVRDLDDLLAGLEPP